MNTRTKKILGVLGLALLLGACSVEKVDEASVGVHYTDGPVEGQKFDHVVEPGGSSTVVNDHVYRLPARQVSYIAANDGTQNGADGPAIVITDQNGVGLSIDMTVRFFLNTREDVLKPFFLEQCQKFDCWNGAIDTPGEGEADGWGDMLNNVYGNTAVAVANDLALGYVAEELRYNNEVKDRFSSEFATAFVAEQERLIGRGDYFCGPGYDREGDNCPNLSVEITKITYVRPELEQVRENQQLAVEQTELAVQQEAAAAAEARVAAARATGQNIALMQAEAMLACAQNPNAGACNLNIVVDDSGQVGVSIPVG